MLRGMYSFCSGVNKGHPSSSFPGFLTRPRCHGIRLKWHTSLVYCSLTDILSLPCPSEVGPVSHEPLAHLNFLLCVLLWCIQRHSKNKLYLIAVHDAHPFWPRVDGGPVCEKKDKNIPARLYIAGNMVKEVNYWKRSGYFSCKIKNISNGLIDGVQPAVS